MERTAHATRRLVLRPYEPGDFAAWRDACISALPSQRRYDVGAYLPSRCTAKAFAGLLARHAELERKDEVYVYAAFAKTSGELVGIVDLWVMCRKDRQMANLGYQVFNRHWRKGYGSEAARAGLKVAFTELGLHRIEAAINLDNKPSLKLARKIGMHREGIKRGYIYEDGAWVDHVVYVATPADVGLRDRPPPEA